MNQTILGIAGSLRRDSYNRAVLRAAQSLAPDDATLEIFELDGIPGFNQDDEGNPPERVKELKRRVERPMRSSSSPPSTTTPSPGCSRTRSTGLRGLYGDNAREGKPVAVMGASIGMIGTARAQYHLCQCFVFLNMYPINHPEVMIAHAATKFDNAGNYTDEKGKELIRDLLRSLIEWTRQLGKHAG